MKYIVYNATKDVRLPGAFEYRDALFSRYSLGRILRMLIDKEWSGDRIAIMPTDKWEVDKANLEKAGITHDPVEADTQSIVFPTKSAVIPAIIGTEDSYIEFNKGSVYAVHEDETIDRFDDLIPLISIDPPAELFETYNVGINGKWAFQPLYPMKNGENLSAMYDVENFYRTYTDEEIHRLGVPEFELWAGDLVSMIETDQK